MAEAVATRWRRRATTIPLMLGTTAVAVLGLPVLGPLAIAVDAVKLRFGFPTLRVYLVALQYLLNDSVEIVLAPVLWLVAGAGTGLDGPASIARHERLQWWSVRLLGKRAEQLLGLEVVVDDDDADRLRPGPVIVISRHASALDASLPALVYGREGFRVTGVIMAELLADPGFDLIYGRVGSVFIPRDDGPAARAEIERMAATADARTALVIFPEGRLFTPSARDRSLARLADSDPSRAERLADLDRVLPPRPGGFLELLTALPEADVVLLDHRGLDRFGRLSRLLGAVPVAEPVRVTARRHPRSTIPQDDAGRTAWLDERWLELDAALADA